MQEALTCTLKTPQILPSATFCASLKMAGMSLRSPLTILTPCSCNFLADDDSGFLVTARILKSFLSGDARSALMVAPPCCPVAPVIKTFLVMGSDVQDYTTAKRMILDEMLSRLMLVFAELVVMSRSSK